MEILFIGVKEFFGVKLLIGVKLYFGVKVPEFSVTEALFSLFLTN